MNRSPVNRYLVVIVSALILAEVAGGIGCSIPVLENEECRAAKNSVREFYSFHFGNDMHPSPEGLEVRKRYLTPELAASLVASTDDQSDYFTQTVNDYPRAFRVGSCREAGPDKAMVEVLLFWKDDFRTEQRPINIEAERSGDKWLVNKVSKN